MVWALKKGLIGITLKSLPEDCSVCPWFESIEKETKCKNYKKLFCPYRWKKDNVDNVIDQNLNIKSRSHPL